MAKLTFQMDRCKGCGLCVNACPKGLLAIAKDKINEKGHHPASAVRPAQSCARTASFKWKGKVTTWLKRF